MREDQEKSVFNWQNICHMCFDDLKIDSYSKLYCSKECKDKIRELNRKYPSKNFVIED